ncbi:hypothetical protein ASF60_05160 [Methylobacterium sp. Leaf113]|uniref:DNA-binding protein n=1 Tax=Methylobacterium sp. Leaf113 TaxID=1736259 RepID=UPI0006F1F50A|nr:DNA-binding protein [Methylobacterium sp. Leaf113]KQP85489.1 hypothetical protein ASF60_05160 [Methylobacterium sp. Leaf113]
MPDRDEVFKAADKLRSEGKDPSYRLVRDLLPNGGSPGPILRLLDEWKEARRYHPKLEVKDVPNALMEHLATYGKAAWKMAQERALIELRREREGYEEIRRLDLLDRETLLGLLDGTRALLETAEDDIDALKARLEKAEDHLARVRAERYWDQVMAEVHAILPAEGAMKPRDVLPRLSEATIRGALLHKEELDLRTLKKKMKGRSDQQNYFAFIPDGYRFARIA